MKKLLLVTGIIVSVPIVLIYIFALTGAFAIFMPEPPEPQIKYGEFPFTITYERNGEILTYEDVIICEYEGIVSLGTAGKAREWSGKLKSGNDSIVLLQSTTRNGASFEISISPPLLPQYYMGEQVPREDYERLWDDHHHFWYTQDGIDSYIKQEEVWEQYRIKIINIECSLPIENKFG